MNPRFTPAPWTIDKNLKWNVKGQDGEKVAEVGIIYKSKSEVDANVALIATAPDLYNGLLELLGMTHKLVTEHFKPESQVFLRQDLNKYAHLLAKARGDE